MRNTTTTMPVRAIRKQYFQFMGQASHSCEMNHLIDCGEWSSQYDEEIHESYYQQFKEWMKKMSFDLEAFRTLVNEYGRKDPQDSGCWGCIAQEIAMYEA